MEGTMGEIRLFAGPLSAAIGKIPRGWKLCDGEVLNIQQYASLWAVVGTTYGGDGESTFALPDLRSRVPVGTGTAEGRPAYALAQKAGAEAVPTEDVSFGSGGSPSTTVNVVRPEQVSNSNVQPIIALHYIICIQGEFPQRERER
jgi:microcystin-dependent protein